MMRPAQHHTFKHWPVFLALAVALAAAAGKAIVVGYEVNDVAFMAVFGGGFTAHALCSAALAIQTRRHTMKGSEANDTEAFC